MNKAQNPTEDQAKKKRKDHNLFITSLCVHPLHNLQDKASLKYNLKKHTNLKEKTIDVYMGIASFMKRGGFMCAFPRRKTLCERLGGMPERTLDRHIHILKECGLLYVKRRGLRRANEYYFIKQKFHENSQGDKKDMDDKDRKIKELEAENSRLKEKMATPIVNLVQVNNTNRRNRYDVEKLISIAQAYMGEDVSYIKIRKHVGFFVSLFRDYCDNSYDKYRKYWERVRSSDFLMGKMGWKATIGWCLNKLRIKQILEGFFDNGSHEYRKAQAAGLNTPTIAELKERKELLTQKITTLLEPDTVKNVRFCLLEQHGSGFYKSWIDGAIFKENNRELSINHVGEWKNNQLVTIGIKDKLITSMLGKYDKLILGREVINLNDLPARLSHSWEVKNDTIPQSLDSVSQQSDKNICKQMVAPAIDLVCRKVKEPKEQEFLTGEEWILRNARRLLEAGF